MPQFTIPVRFKVLMEVTIKMEKYIQEATVYIDEAGDLGMSLEL